MLLLRCKCVIISYFVHPLNIDYYGSTVFQVFATSLY